MDSVPTYEFHKIFRRISSYVDLQGAFSPEDIDKKLKKAQKKFREQAKRANSEAEKKKLYSKAKGLQNLEERDFAGRTIAEAVNDRYGIVNLTLHYGTIQAEQMKLAFERARIRREGRRRL